MGLSDFFYHTVLFHKNLSKSPAAVGISGLPTTGHNKSTTL
jgi:hypothetical protein